MSVFYEIDGQRYPRVTAICAIMANDGLAYWRGRIGNTEADRVSREATTLGTAVHAVVDWLNTRGTDALANDALSDGRVAYLATDALAPQRADDVAALAKPYVRWYREHVRAVVASERLVVSRKLGYAGTVDLVALLDDDATPTVIDLKTSNSVSESWRLQTAAYQLALDEADTPCARRLIVQLPSKDPGVCHTHEMDDHVRDQRAFLNCLKIYQWRASLEPPKPLGPRIRFTRNGQ